MASVRRQHLSSRERRARLLGCDAAAGADGGAAALDRRDADRRLQPDVPRRLRPLGGGDVPARSRADAADRRGAAGGVHLRVPAVPLHALRASRAADGVLHAAVPARGAPDDRRRPADRRAAERVVPGASVPVVLVLRHLPRDLSRAAHGRADARQASRGCVAIAAGARGRRRARSGSRRSDGAAVPLGAACGRRTAAGRDSVLQRDAAELPRGAPAKHDARRSDVGLGRPGARAVHGHRRPADRARRPVATAVGRAHRLRAGLRVRLRPVTRFQRPAVSLVPRIPAAVPRSPRAGAHGNGRGPRPRRPRRLRRRQDPARVDPAWRRAHRVPAAWGFRLRGVPVHAAAQADPDAPAADLRRPALGPEERAARAAAAAAGHRPRADLHVLFDVLLARAGERVQRFQAAVGTRCCSRSCSGFRTRSRWRS